MLISLYPDVCCSPEPSPLEGRYTAPKDYRMSYGNRRVRVDKPEEYDPRTENDSQAKDGLSWRQPL